MRLLTLAGLVLFLAACTHDPHAVRVIDANNATAKVSSDGAHLVSKGDTLYSIAFRYNTTVTELARLNGLREPYTIFPEQSLIVPSSATKIAVAKRPVSFSNKDRAKAPQPKKATKKVTPVAAPVDTGPWLRPTDAPISAKFSQTPPINKGVDFSAKHKSSVKAARGGKVVYAGDGLKAYGLLIIIKHDPHYLSAYAYNHRLAVKEGDLVKRGQKIAEVGLKGGKPTLHFEVRKDGKPLDPLRVLP